MIPKKVSICGIPHTVIQVSQNFSGDCHFGEIDYAKCTIKINSDMPEAMQMQALLHEMVHGMLVLMGFNDLTEDEQFVQAMALAINQNFTLRKEGG